MGGVAPAAMAERGTPLRSRAPQGAPAPPRPPNAPIPLPLLLAAGFGAAAAGAAASAQAARQGLQEDTLHDVLRGRRGGGGRAVWVGGAAQLGDGAQQLRRALSAPVTSSRPAPAPHPALHGPQLHSAPQVRALACPRHSSRPRASAAAPRGRIEMCRDLYAAALRGMRG